MKFNLNNIHKKKAHLINIKKFANCVVIAVK